MGYSPGEKMSAGELVDSQGQKWFILTHKNQTKAAGGLHAESV